MGTEPESGGGETVGMAHETVERGHEGRDVNVRAILAVGAGLVVTAAVVQVVLYFQMEGLWRHRQSSVPPAPPVAAALPSAPPEPRLQTAPALDLRALRAAEDAQLNGYGWVDRSAGTVHIPIDRAIDLLVAEAARAGRPGPGAAEQRSEPAAHTGPAEDAARAPGGDAR